MHVEKKTHETIIWFLSIYINFNINTKKNLKLDIFHAHWEKKPQQEKPMYGSCQYTFVWDTLTKCKDHVCIPSL